MWLRRRYPGARAFAVAVAGILLIALLSAGATKAGRSKIGAYDLALARDYVFAACVIDRYAGTPLAAEAEAWAGGIVEHGNLPADAYPALARLARAAPAPGVTHDGAAMRLQSCFDFIHGNGFSDRLRDVLRR